MLFTSACVALITGLHLPFAFDRSFSAREFLQLWIVTLLVEVTLYSVVFMVDYALVARAVLRAERGMAHQAQFRYMKLKQPFPVQLAQYPRLPGLRAAHGAGQRLHP